MREEETENTWPNAAVAMMLAAHSAGLFLKGAIVSRDPKVAKVHRIDQLAETYTGLFPEPEFVFDIPFQSEYPGISEEDIVILKKDEPTPSVQFRYPVKAQGIEWQGIQGFEAQGFLEPIAELRESFARIS